MYARRNESENRVKLYDVYSLNDTVAVEVLHVDSPTNIWITPVETKSKYNELVLSMMKYYMDEAKGRIIDNDDLKFGKVCVVRCRTTVRRARIVYVDDADYAEVWFIDEGCSDYCYTWDIYHLDDEFEKLPAAAIQCGLADIQPISLEWPDSAQRYITDLCLGQIVTATLCMRVPDNNTLWLKLSIEGNDLGNDLIWEGDALPHRQRLRCYS